jgi:arginase
MLTRARARIIGAASGLGARDPGCEDGPVAFFNSGAWRQLQARPGLYWGETLFPSAVRSESMIDRVAELCQRMAEAIAHTLISREFPVVIGGDHSVAIGTWSGAARFVGKPIGMLWMDAHMDSHTPQTTYSGAIHGMPLACLLGEGDPRLLGLGLAGPQLSHAHTVVFGVRSFEPEEPRLLQRLGVRVIRQSEIQRRGFRETFSEALGIAASSPSGFGLSLDLDVVDPALAPGVGTPVPEGLAPPEVLEAIRDCASMAGLLAMEIVEYNPARDRHGMTASLIGETIGKILT